MVASLIGAAIVALATTANAEVLKHLLDKVLVPPDAGDIQAYYASQEANLLWVTVMAVVVTLTKGGGDFLKSYSLSWVQQKAVMNLRKDFFCHLQSLPMRFFATSRTGDLISRLNADIMAIENLFRQCINSLAEPLVILCLISYMFWVQWKLALLIFVIVPILGVVVRALSVRLRRAGERLQAKAGDISALVQETVTGIRIIKAFGFEKRREDFFETELQAGFGHSMKAVKYTALTSPAVEFADSIGVALMLYLGSKSVIDGVISPGQLIAFLTCLGLLFQPLKKITQANAQIQASLGAIRRVFEILEEPREIDSGTRTVADPSGGVILNFDNICFAYSDDKPVLKQLTFEARPGETIALVGPSGAGKTTVLGLLPRFIREGSGKILINGEEADSYSLKSLRSIMGIVPQEVVLFSGTIADNVRMGRPEATDEEVREACRMANAHEFIEKLPEEYNSRVAEMGVGLSGGQRQRIAIARALLRDPALLLLDEATSALDSQSETLVQESLKTLMKGRTTLVVAHRITTIRDADRILVMEQGQLIDSGRHEELLGRCSLYAELCRGLSEACP